MEQITFTAPHTKTATVQFILPDYLNTLKILISQSLLRGNEALFCFSLVFEG